MSNGMRKCTMGLLVTMLVGAAGCKVQVDKSGNGEDDHVKIATPFGSIAVNKGQTTAADVGLPPYPGSAVTKDGEGHDSANVDMGFGSWKLRVRVAHYSTADNRDQVVAFYRKALSEYGVVIECAGDKPVGTPTRTGEGLTCADSDHGNHPAHVNRSSGLQLKAGSPRHQHLVALDGDDATATKFSLIALDLPHGGQDEGEGTN